jgi:hypothetical protein
MRETFLHTENSASPNEGSFSTSESAAMQNKQAEMRARNIAQAQAMLLMLGPDHSLDQEEAWADTYAASFAELFTNDESFHNLVMLGNAAAVAARLQQQSPEGHIH